MISKDWTEIVGIPNVGEDDERVVGCRCMNHMTGELYNSIKIAFCAFGGLKLIELQNVKDVCGMDELSRAYENMRSTVGDDFEVVVPVIDTNGDKLLVSIDDSGEVNYAGDTNGNSVSTDICTVSVEEYDACEMESLEYDLLEKFDFV